MERLLSSLHSSPEAEARGDHLGEEAVQGPQHLAQSGMRGGLRPLQVPKILERKSFPRPPCSHSPC